MKIGFMLCYLLGLLFAYQLPVLLRRTWIKDTDFLEFENDVSGQRFRQMLDMNYHVSYVTSLILRVYFVKSVLLSSIRYDFTCGETSSVIREGILARVNEFWPKFTSIPDPIKNVMFDEFLNRFRWRDDVSSAIVRKLWNAKGSLKYREWVSNMKETKKKPSCLPQEIFDQFLMYWELPDVRQLSEKNSELRRKNPKLHRGGSRSTADYRNDLFDEYQREPTSWEVYVRTHRLESRDDSTNDRWVDNVSAQFAEKYQAKIDELLGQSIEITYNIEEEVFSSLNIGRGRDHRSNYGNAPKRYKDAIYSVSESDARERVKLKEELKNTKDELQELKNSFSEFKNLVYQRINGDPSQNQPRQS